MTELTAAQREAIIKRRHSQCAKDSKRHPISKLQIHHMNGNPQHNDPKNLKVLCKPCHNLVHQHGGGHPRKKK